MFGLIPLLIGWGVPAKYAKIVAIVGAVVLALVFLFGLKACYDHSIIANHDAKTEASAAKADRKADTKASEQRDKDIARQNQEADQLMKVQQNAKTENDRRLAFHRCLSLQQRARANGLKPPTCV